jgi:hypothetical protein
LPLNGQIRHTECRYPSTHHPTKPVASLSSPLAANLPTWIAFSGTLKVRAPGVIQMIANSSLDVPVIEDVMRKENTFCVFCFKAGVLPYGNDDSTLKGISSQLTSSMNGRYLLLLRHWQGVRNTDSIALSYMLN